MLCSIVLCEPGRALPVVAWLAVPLLFVASVMGLIGAVGLPLNLIGGQMSPSTEVFGAAAAVTLALSSCVPSLRRVLSLGYPLIVLAAGIGLHWIHVPTVAAIGVGLPALAVSTVLCLWGRADYQLWSPSPA